MKLFSLLLLFFASLFVFSCITPQSIDENEFDQAKWKSDRGGCSGERKVILEQLESIKEKLKGLSEVELRKILGKPDFSELYSRNQKFYGYYVDASSKCETPTDGQARLIQIRFDAINQVNEVVMIRQ